MLNYVLGAVMLFVCLQNLCAQKREFEQKIPKAKFPEFALWQIGSKFEGANCVRFYREIGTADTTYEAKLKWKGGQYSIEFDVNGNWLDTEQTVKFNELPTAQQTTIGKALAEDFTKHNIKKCQVQTSPGSTTNRYEIEVEGKKAGKPTFLFEYLFEPDGTIASRQQIILPSNDINLY